MKTNLRRLFEQLCICKIETSTRIQEVGQLDKRLSLIASILRKKQLQQKNESLGILDDLIDLLLADGLMMEDVWDRVGDKTLQLASQHSGGDPYYQYVGITIKGLANLDKERESY